MKKYLISLAVLAGVLTSGVASASLYDYYASQGQNLPSVSVRAVIADSYGISNYTGTRTQNLALESFLAGDALGVTIPNTSALIDTYLASGISKTDTSMTLASGLTRSGASLSGYICFTLDANTPQVEYVCGTAVGANISGLLRGVDVTNPNTTSSALAFPHRRLASVQVTDYPILQILSRMVGGQDSTGSGTFIVGDGTNSIKFENTTTSNKYIYAWGNAGNPFLRHNGSNWQFSDDGTNIVSMVTGGSGLAASTTQGIQIINSLIGINASSTTGLTFDASGKLYQKVSATSGLQYAFGSNGIEINTTTLSALISTTTPTASKIPLAQSNGDIDLGWIPDGASSLQYYTAGETLDSTSGPISVYLNPTDGRVYKTSSNVSTTTFPFVGFVTSGQNQSAGTSIAVQQSGLVYNFTGLATGSIYFISTSGTVSSTAGAVGYKIGRAVSPTTLFIEKGKKVLSGYLSISSTATTTINTGFRVSSVLVITNYTDTYNAHSAGGWTVNGGSYNIYSFGNSPVSTGVGTNAVNTYSYLGAARYRGNIVNITKDSFGFALVDLGGAANPLNVFYQAEE